MFKCAVFLSGGTPVSPAALEEQKLSFLKGTVDGVVISVPVANIWGRNDVVWAEQSDELSKLCNPQTSAVFVHEGVHEVPGTGPQVTQIVHVIRRVIDRALLSQ